MPDFIKQAMVDEPIDIPETPNHTFDLDDVPELVQENSTVRRKTRCPTHNLQLLLPHMKGTHLLISSLLERYRKRGDR